MYRSICLIPGPGDSPPAAHMNSDGIPVLDLRPDVPGTVTVQLSPRDHDAAIAWLDALMEQAYDLALQVRQRQRGLDRLLTAIDGVDQASVRLECHLDLAHARLRSEHDALVATLARIERLWREWQYGERSATEVEPGIAYCADQLGNALGDYHASAVTP